MRGQRRAVCGEGGENRLKAPVVLLVSLDCDIWRVFVRRVSAEVAVKADRGAGRLWLQSTFVIVVLVFQHLC